MDRKKIVEKNSIDNWIAYGKREIIISNSLPDIMEIESSAYCNMHCVFCPHDKMKRKKGFMTYELFQKIIDSCKHVKSMGLHHMGEPLMNPDIFKFIKYAEDKGISTTISTNALLLDEHKIEQILDAGLSRIIISLDGADKEKQEKLRAGSNYEQVVNNINNLLLRKVQSGKQKPYVQVKMIIAPETKNDKDIFISEWKDKPGLDQILFNDERTWAGDQIRHDKYVVRENSKRLPCRYLWESVAILYDGRVVPCCKDYEGKYILGDLSKGDTLESIWNSDRMQEIRAAHIDNRQNEIELCKNCNEWPGHNAMNEEETIAHYKEFKLKKKTGKQQKILKKGFE